MKLYEFNGLIKNAILQENDYRESIDDLELYDVEEHFHKPVEYCGWTIKQEEQHGGEGEGDSYYVIISISNDKETHIVQYSGFYDSWNGTEWEDWDDAVFVEPKEVTVIQYVPIK